MENHSHITIRNETKEQLDKLKKTGQSYDGLIQDLISIFKNTN